MEISLKKMYTDNHFTKYFSKIRKTIKSNLFIFKVPIIPFVYQITFFLL